MAGNCCDTNIAPDAKNKKLKTLAVYMRQSVFCGVAGSAKFVIALSSYIQAAAFLRLYRHNLNFVDAERQHLVKLAAIRGMKQGILPAIEMFVLMPGMFVALHLYASLSVLACIALCWAAMFSVCLFVRLTGIISKCPTVESPLYSRGFPFPTMEGGRGDLDDVRRTGFDYNLCKPQTPSLWKAYGIALLFVIPRCLTLIGTLVLLSVETLCFVPILLRDTYTASKNAWKLRKESAEKAPLTFGETLQQKDILTSLFVAVIVDVLWVASLGLTGIMPIHMTTSYGRENGAPEAKLSEILTPHSAKTTLQDNDKAADATNARAS